MSVRRLSLHSGFNGDDSVRNVFTVNDTGGDPTFDDYYTWMQAIWHIGLLAEITSTWASTSLVEEVPAGDGGWTFAREAPLSIIGTGTDDALPRQCAAVIIGTVPGRRRGKKFIAGIIESAQSDGQLDGACLAALEGSANAYQDPTIDVPAANWQSGVCAPDGTSFAAFNGHRVDQIIGTQRRRKQGVGQ